MPRTWTIPNLEDAVSGVTTLLTRDQMLALAWPVEPAEYDIDDPTVELVPERIIVPEVFRCPRCHSSWPRAMWADHIRDVRGIARFPEDFICSGCMRTEMIYNGYLRSQWLADIGAPQQAINAMKLRRPIQATGPMKQIPGPRPAGQRPPPGRR